MSRGQQLMALRSDTCDEEHLFLGSKIKSLHAERHLTMRRSKTWQLQIDKMNLVLIVGHLFLPWQLGLALLRTCDSTSSRA